MKNTNADDVVTIDGYIWNNDTRTVANAVNYNAQILMDALNRIAKLEKDIKSKAESEDVVVANKNLCDSCTTKNCIFQSGIVRNHCDFYKAESEGT